jgi:predicted DNA-binding transcriptional regulator AlpA
MKTLDLIELAELCPELTISVKVSDLIYAFKETSAELLEQYARENPVASVEEEKLISPRETKDKLKISTTTLWRWDNSGYLKPVRVGGLVRYRLSDVNAMIEKRGGVL